MSLSRVLVLPLLAFALVLAGCGSEPPKEVTKAQYQQELDRLGQVASDAGTELGRSIDIATFNGNVDKFSDTLRDVAGQLDDLKPPANVQAANATLADSFRDWADEMEPVKEARRKSIIEARKALFRVGHSQAVLDARQAVKELRDAGYDVRRLAI